MQLLQRLLSSAVSVGCPNPNPTDETLLPLKGDCGLEASFSFSCSVPPVRHRLGFPTRTKVLGLHSGSAFRWHNMRQYIQSEGKQEEDAVDDAVDKMR